MTPPKYSDSARNTIETYLRAGVEPLQIASEVRFTHQWVYTCGRSLMPSTLYLLLLLLLRRWDTTLVRINILR
jgi:hypothetical protein